ncbi:MAG: F0F1 ATP synthase subunit A [Pseudomonadota bacterium]
MAAEAHHAAGPLEQFTIEPLIPMHVGRYDLSFSNASLFMLLAALLVSLMMTVAVKRGSLVPTRMQSLAELVYEFIANMVRDNAGHDARRFTPLVFSLFMFILLGNLLGMIPYTFTFTSHIIVTFALALTVFILVTVLGFALHGLHFFSLFVPQGVPKVLLPLMVLIEVISYLTRPISLSVRLFANMMAGHTMMAVFAGFAVSLGVGLGWLTSLAPLLLVIALTGFEILVAVLQAYVFAILTCLYLRDAIELH